MFSLVVLVFNWQEEAMNWDVSQRSYGQNRFGGTQTRHQSSKQRIIVTVPSSSLCFLAALPLLFILGWTAMEQNLANLRLWFWGWGVELCFKCCGEGRKLTHWETIKPEMKKEPKALGSIVLVIPQALFLTWYWIINCFFLS